MINSGERLVFVDLETAGREPHRPIRQIAAIAIDRELSERESFEIKIAFPDCEADPRSICKQGRRSRVWKRQAVSPNQAAQAFSSFLKRHATLDVLSKKRRGYKIAQLVAHNAGFDAEFLKHWFEQMDVFLPASFRVLCTMQRAVWLFHESPSLTPPRDYKLSTLCRYFGVHLDRSCGHDAMVDVRATVQLYRAMLSMEQTVQYQDCG